MATGDSQTSILPVGTIVKSPLSMKLPTIDVASYVFSSGTKESRGAPVYFNADSPSTNFSLQEAEVYVKRFAKGLLRHGLRKGDRVLLYSGNKLLFPVVLWSVTAAGCVFTGIAPSASAGGRISLAPCLSNNKLTLLLELAYQLKDSGASILLTSRSGIQTALKAAAEVSLPLSQIFAFGDPNEDLEQLLPVAPWTKLWVTPEEAETWQWHQITTFEEASATTAVLNYSSGTTGLPKGVQISHYNLVANSEQVLFKRSHFSDTPESKRRRENLALSGERWLTPLPMYHAYGQTYSCLSAARLGARIFIMMEFSLEKYLLFLDIYRITFMTTVPTIITMLDKYEHPHRFNLNAVEVVLTGSAPLDGDLASRITQKFLKSGVVVKQGWGMTESTCSVASFAPDDYDDGRSVGWLNPNSAAQIVPVEKDKEDPSSDTPATIGELWVSGPQMMQGYWQDDKATRDTVVQSDGHRWIRTGDLAYIDSRGYIYIVERLKELIKVKGLQVAPAELQLALENSPLIPSLFTLLTVRCFSDGQEYPRAFVVRRTETLKEAEVFDIIKNRFARHKWLTGGVYFVDAIPRTPSGKVQKRYLPTDVTERSSKL
ncbi:uncharacterized protein N7483_005174 [Penicillium malachiteum]|uniref:uncharacterized protein n=1 Tax=Penicillium malachiteum TaxID=1324776 RepID=UPI00254957D5|nr:uncharacterized protein N7483_005174 [Penicillium malachiteum]KAJ5730666.1 hypothetical protein N7483_005174 [Penicillium malachiteum]